MNIRAPRALAVLFLVAAISGSLVSSLLPLSVASATTEDGKPLLQFISKQKDAGPSLENTTLAQGQSMVVPIVAVPASGYEIQAVNLEVRDVPPNVYAWIVWNSYPIFANEGSDRSYVKDYQLKVYVDSNVEPGEYSLTIAGTNGVAKNIATSEDIQIMNETFETFRLTVTSLNSKINMDIGNPEYQSKQMCVEDDSSPGDGTMCYGFVGEEEFPIVISSSSFNGKINETIRLSASGIPEGAWAKFVPDNLILSDSGNGEKATARARLMLAGAVRPFTSFPPDTIVPVIQASSASSNATNFLPIVKTMNMTVLHAEDKISFPVEITQNINGTNFGYTGVVYDPYDNSSSTLPVSLSIAGMATQDGGKIVSPLPEWIRAELPISSFTLNSTEPYYFLVKVITHLAPVGTYYLAIDESIAEKHFTGYVKVDVNPPVYYSAALPSLPAAAEVPQLPTKEIEITEVELNSANGTQWIEVYNPTDHEISLATMHINGSDGHELQILAGMSDLLPQDHVLIGLQPDDSYPLWSNTNNTITIYQSDPDLKARGIVDNVTLWDRTPQLTDTSADARTWQSNGTEWIFQEQTPMRAIPEFSGVVVMFVTITGLAGALVTASRLKVIN